jgi:hypothetical protein
MTQMSQDITAKVVIKKAMSKSENSGHDSDESRHNLETLIPRNNAKMKIIIKNAKPESEDSGADSKSQCMTWKTPFLVKRSKLLQTGHFKQ